MIVRRKGNYDVHLCQKKLTKTHVKEKILGHHYNICIHHTILTNALQQKKNLLKGIVFVVATNQIGLGPKIARTIFSFQSMHNA